MYKILHTEWSEGWGGQEMRILLEAKELRQRGHKIIVACQPESGLEKNLRKEGIPLAKIPMGSNFDLRALSQIFHLIKKEGVDIVNTHSSVDSWIASFAAKLARTPLLLRTRHLSLPISNHFFNFVYKLPDFIITTGEAIRERLIKINKFPPPKIISIPTGVNLDKFNPQEKAIYLKKEWGLEEGPIISKVAVLRSWKRHDLFLEAAQMVLKEYPKSKFLIVGEGPQRENIEKKIKDLRLKGKVILTGHREDIPQILSITDIVVLASSKAEGLPQILTQALAMERPVVATEVGSVKEIVQNGSTGILVEPEDISALASAILKLIKDKELALSLGKRGRKLVEEKFTSEIMVERLLQLYQKGLKDKERRRKNAH